MLDVDLFINPDAASPDTAESLARARRDMVAPLKLIAEWFWTDRWTGSSAFLLPLEARGLYREMLTQAWRRGAQLPNDPTAIQRAVGVTQEEWTRAWPLIAPYWQVENGHLINRTQVEIYKKVAQAQEKRIRRARKAAGARWISNA